MNSEKLMKIVQAVNDSHCNPVDIDSALDFKFISRYLGSNIYKKGSIHATDGGEAKLIWEYICTVEEFSQCVKEMSAGYGKKGTKMKDNKHPHHDLIVEWAKDTSKTFQVNTPDTLGWFNVNQPAWNTAHKYRFKPRDFTKGHWYPCVDKDGYNLIYYFDGEAFQFANGNCANQFNETDFKWIGESLGVINFGE